ncbi:MAG: hypothetical protein WDZ41_04075 [Candidatus Babeliales bacterium]
MKNNNFCCDILKESVSDLRSPLGYSPKIREFFIASKDNKHIVQAVNYCPWCGEKFPKDLRDEYFEILKSEYNLELCIFDIKKNKNLPEEFKTDQWWKKRDL